MCIADSSPQKKEKKNVQLSWVSSTTSNQAQQKRREINDRKETP
jgi:hypothetical protein